MPLIRIADPLTEPVTLLEAKLHAKVDHTDDDTLITALISAAREQAEHLIGRALITQTQELVLDSFPASEISLHLPDVQAIASVKYINLEGVERTMDAAEYSLDMESTPCWLLPAYGFSWPPTLDTVNTVRIRFTVGYGATAADVPQAIRAWLLVRVASLYAQREAHVSGVSVAELPGRFIDGLLDPYRVWRT
jgi:uncharacterized phiE125 gp8 family phage protein